VSNKITNQTSRLAQWVSAWQGKLNFISALNLSLFLASLFISPTGKTIFFISGFIIWLISLGGLNGKLKILNSLIFLQIIFQFFLQPFQLPQAAYSLSFFKYIFVFYFPWFWITSSLGKFNKKLQRIPLFVFILTGSLTSLLIFIQNFGYLQFSARGVSGFSCQPFTTGGLLLMTTFSNLHFVEKLWKRPLTAKIKSLSSIALINLCLQIVALLMLSQRAIWLALMFGIVIWVLFNLKKLGLWRIATVALGGLIAAFSTYHFSDKFRSKFTALTNLASDKVGLGCRLGVWKANWQSFLESPLIGQGKTVEYECFGDKLVHAHNIFLQQLVVQGLIGFTLWMSFLTTAFVKIFKRKNQAALIAGFVALMVEGLLENWWNDSEVISGFWFFLASAIL